MKKIFRRSPKITLILLFILIHSCKKETDIFIKDSDGNVYTSVTIGTQVWMVENLKATKYNDATTIPLVTNNFIWSNLSTAGYCWYNNDSATYSKTYGALYNWHAVRTNKLCPTGWHVPTDAEWTILTTFLGGGSISGGKLKEPGTIHWESPNIGATNESNFTALPGGYRDYDGVYHSIGGLGGWWSYTEFSSGHASYRYITSYDVGLNSYIDFQQCGFSVRCIKD